MKVDTIIVGAGSAGLSALREVRRSTDDFVLINDGHWGTTCAAVGCMPSKALIEAANAVHRRHTLEALGIRGADGLRADIPAVLARVRALRDQFVKGPSSVPDKLGKRAIAGRARLTGPGAVEVDGRRIEARAIILAPGSRPIVPEPWRAFGDRLLTSDTLFEQTDLPRRIAVIGPGAIGRRGAAAAGRAVSAGQPRGRHGAHPAAGLSAGQRAGAGAGDHCLHAVFRRAARRPAGPRPDAAGGARAGGGRGHGLRNLALAPFRGRGDGR